MSRHVCAASRQVHDYQNNFYALHLKLCTSFEMIQGKCCKHLIGSFVDLHKIFAAINPLQVSCGLVPMQHLMTLEHFVCLVRKELNE